jgi:hypothetical protein
MSARTHATRPLPKATTPAPPSRLTPLTRAATASGGQALDKHTQREMSARFGHDFSQVRIHTDHRAEESAHAFGANAYAHGSDIVFGGGKYNPGSRETDRLLAHELTHVVQQSQFGGGDWGRTSHKNDASEREADGLASQVMLGQSVQVRAAPQAAIARDDMESTGGGGGFVDDGTQGTTPTNDLAAYEPYTAPKIDMPEAPATPYSGDYPWSTSTGDAASSTAWDIGGMIPGIGTIVNGAGLAIDLGKAGIDTALGDTKSANSHLNNATQDAMGMIPGVGTVMGYGNLMVDSAATGDRLGGGHLGLPTSSEAFDAAVSAPAAPAEQYNGGEEGGRAY